MELEGYEFEHIKTKRGSDIMIGELDKYLKDNIDSNNFMENNTHYILECPYCKNAYKYDSTYSGQYTKKKLYVLKDGRTGFCFRCDRAFINLEENIDIKFDIPELPLSMKDFELVKLPTTGLWTLNLFDEFEEFDNEGFEYLKGRNPYFEKLAKILRIRYTDHNPVIPFYFKGELIYYQLKLAFGNPRIKYFSPPISYKPAYIIEHGSNKKFIVCEGTFDAISLLMQCPDGTPFAVLGSTITDYQLTMLRTYIPEIIYVYMDKTELSINVADRIRAYIDYAEVRIIKSDGTDPEENLQKKIKYNLQIQWIK